jgi:outer membrane protein TolC
MNREEGNGKDRGRRVRAVLYAAAWYGFVICPVVAQQTEQAPPAAEGRRIGSGQALQTAMKRNPDLRAALAELERSGQDVRAEEGLYPFVLQLDGGYTHASNPSLASQGEVTFRANDTARAGAELSKSLPEGTQAALRLEGARSQSKGPSWDPSGNDRLGPGYGLSTRLEVTQPLLRGAGTGIGQAGLRQAIKAEEVARRKLRRSTSQMIEQVLSTYWELWYAERALEIDIKARDLARSQLEETETRVAAGGVAPVEVLSFQTRLASLEEAIVAAEEERVRLGVELGRLMGAPELGGRLATEEAEQPPVPETDPSLRDALKDAVNGSPEVLELAAALALSQERAEVAADELRPRLDLQGWVQAQTLGNDELGPVFEQYGQSEAYSAYLGLLYELPLDDRRRQAKRAAAALEVEINRQQLVAARDRVTASVRSAVEKLLSARKRVAFAGQTLEAAEKQAQAERERHSFGAAIYVQVREAEEAVREAGLRLERARVDVVQADIALQGLTGALARKVRSE